MYMTFHVNKLGSPSPKDLHCAISSLSSNRSSFYGQEINDQMHSMFSALYQSNMSKRYNI